MERRNLKLSNYVGQTGKEKKEKDYFVSVDKDLQNLWVKVNEITGFFPGYNYNDINLGSVSLGTGAGAPDNVTISSSGLIVKGFDGNVTTEQIYGSVEILHSYQEGTDIIPHVHWMPTTANTGNVKWQLEYALFKNNGTVTSTTTTITVSSSANGLAWEGILAAFSIISGTNITIGDQLVFRFFRNPTDGADNYGDDAAVNTIGFHFKQNTLGSRQISSK